jgi:starch synthase
LPVIATDHSGGPDVIRDGQDGFVVPIRDADALASRLAELAGDTERRRDMGRRARERVASSFKLEHYGQRLETNVISRRRPNGNNEAERIAS